MALGAGGVHRRGFPPEPEGAQGAVFKAPVELASHDADMLRGMVGLAGKRPTNLWVAILARADLR